MISLKDISLNLYIAEGLKVLRGEQHENALLLVENGVYDCGALEERINSGDPRFQKEIFLRILSLVKSRLKIVGTTIKEPVVYIFDTYDKYPHLKKRLVKDDKLISSSSLPIFTPIETNHRALMKRVENISIGEARELIGTIAPDLRNSLVNILPNLNGSRLKDIAGGIKFYEEQIIRIVESDPTAINYKGTLFYKNAREKRMIIESQLEDIILYMNSLGEDFIWGHMNDVSKNRLLKSVKRASNLQEKILENFISLICGYVTLQELEEGAVENEALKRFVIKPKI